MLGVPLGTLIYASHDAHVQLKVQDALNLLRLWVAPYKVLIALDIFHSKSTNPQVSLNSTSTASLFLVSAKGVLRSIRASKHR